MADSSSDLDHVRAIATLMTESSLTEVEIEREGMRIRVVRAPMGALPHASGTAAAGSAASGPPLGAAASAAAAELEDARHPGAVLSPMVGIAYLSPDPSSPTFVAVGQTVAQGQTLLLIEAMKTFNQIRAAKAGTVTRILVLSGAPVEFGEPLMILD